MTIYAGADGKPPEGLTVTVAVPPELLQMAPYLQEFVAGMVDKLYANRHKQPPRKMEGLRFLGLMQGEVAELAKQCYEDRSSPNLYLELHDVANYAFLMGLSLRLEQEDHQRQPEPTPRPRGLLDWLRLYRLWPGQVNSCN